MPPRIAPLTETEIPEFAGVISAIRADHGYVPNSFLTLARYPGFLNATGLLADALWYDDRLPGQARSLVCFAFSWFSGAVYSSAHLASHAYDTGLPVEKLRAVEDWDTSPVYAAPDRALLRLARQAARMPGEVTNGAMKEMRRHWTEQQILTVVGLIAWHAFLNRWTALMATTLEPLPLARAREALGPMGWQPGIHAPQES